jgi:sugar phosphate isomerase/epimerase
MKKKNLLLAACFLGLLGYVQAQENPVNWVHISSKTGGIEAPNSGGQQTSTAVADFDNDGINDFCISERTQAPCLVWYRRTDKGWDKYVVEGDAMSPEAGTVAADVDGDGDMDIIAGGDGGKTREVYWWENPYPNFERNTAWKRYLIHTGGRKYHDQLIGDFDGDGKTDLVFWSQSEQALFFARIPDDPKNTDSWNCIPVFKYYADGQMEQRGTYPGFKGVNEHEGLAKIDIDGDGIQDIVGGGYWFKYIGKDAFSNNMVDASYSVSRSVAGQFIKGGRPEIIMVVGDGWAPLNFYEYKDHTWLSKTIIEEVSNGHSNSVVDFDGDGNLDLWNAEMTLGGNTDAVNRILLGDGKGNFPREIVISRGIDVHESEMVDLDGDGDLDILGKPYNGDVPRLDIWLQNGTGEIVTVKKGAFNHPFGLEIYSLRFEFAKDVPKTISLMKQMGFKDLEVSGYYGLTPKEFKAEMKKNKLTCSSMIFDYSRYQTDVGGIIKEAKLFGARYVGVGWIPHKTDSFNMDDAKKACEDFNDFGAKVKKAGLKFFYHPHGYEFAYYNADSCYQDYIMKNTRADLVCFELDPFWVKYSGVDPLWYMKKYPGRFELVHLKDLRNDVPGSLTGSAPDETSVPVGYGEIGYPALLREAVKQGIKLFYIEDEAKNAVDQIPLSMHYIESLK